MKFRAKVIRVVDGDTVDLQVDLGFHIFHMIRGLLAGVDTPERGQANFKEATWKLQELLAKAADPAGWIFIDTHKTGKFGRWLIEIEGVNTVLAERWPYDV